MIIKKVKFGKIVFNLSFGLYLSLIIAFCFFPIRFGYSGYDALNNFIPFKSIIDCVNDSFQNHTPHGLLSVIGNLLMLTPLGLFFSFYIKDFKKRLLGVFLFSVSIEVLQFIIGLIIGYNYRSIDIDDIILNVAGGIISCVIFKFVINGYKKKKYSDG